MFSSFFHGAVAAGRPLFTKGEKEYKIKRVTGRKYLYSKAFAPRNAPRNPVNREKPALIVSSSLISGLKPQSP